MRYLIEQILLALDVIVDRRLAHLERFGDLIDRRFVEAAIGEQHRGLFQDETALGLVLLLTQVDAFPDVGTLSPCGLLRHPMTSPSCGTRRGDTASRCNFNARFLADVQAAGHGPCRGLTFTPRSGIAYSVVK